VGGEGVVETRQLIVVCSILAVLSFKMYMLATTPCLFVFKSCRNVKWCTRASQGVRTHYSPSDFGKSSVAVGGEI
jgi:hypothetical protein